MPRPIRPISPRNKRKRLTDALPAEKSLRAPADVGCYRRPLDGRTVYLHSRRSPAEPAAQSSGAALGNGNHRLLSRPRRGELLWLHQLPGRRRVHHLRSVVTDALIQRGEFLTSYTPYQPEIS